MATDLREQKLGPMRWITAGGRAGDCFRALGEHMREEIRDAVATWPLLPRLRRHTASAGAAGRLAAVREASRSGCAAEWAELAAPARGAGVPADDLVLLNLRGDLGRVEGGLGCSDLAWRRGRSFIGHNEDGYPGPRGRAGPALTGWTACWRRCDHLRVSTEIAGLLGRYRPQGEAETADLDRVRALLRTAEDPWRRSIPLHVTGSAVIVHPDSGELLLRWHQRQQAWLQVGGHGDPGETSPLAVALREAREETGLADLVPWPGPELRHVVIVSVPAGSGEPAHEHADLRFVLATRTPQAARPENPAAPLRWVTPQQAQRTTSEPNLRETLARVQRLMTG